MIPKVDQFAVGQKDERRAKLLGIRKGLLFCYIGVDGVFLSLDNGQGAAFAVQ